MGVVYLAEHLRLKKRVALKVLAPELAEDEAYRERFERESQMAAALDHPNIVTVHDAGEVEGLLYIAMRYVEGSDLARLLRTEGPLEAPRALWILGQAAGALDEAHASGLVHRDVKPANILLAPARQGDGERVYLTDFGLAKEWASPARLTRSGYFVGTIHYSSPEQFRGDPIDGRTDVYSLGCVLFECLTGRVPYDRGQDAAVMFAHLQDRPPSVRSIRPQLPSALDQVIGTAMAKDKEDRYPTCGQLIDAARAVALRGEPPPPPGPGEPLAGETVVGAPPALPGGPGTQVAEELRATEEVPPGTRRPGRPWWIALVAALAAGVAAAVFFLLPANPTPDGGGVHLLPASATATSTSPSGIDACQPPHTITFEANRALDGRPTTAWRTSGDGLGQGLTLTFDGRVHIQRLGLIPGYAKVDPCDGTDRFTQNRIIQEVTYTFDDGTSVAQDFRPRPDFQYIEVDEVTSRIVITVQETSAPGKPDGRDYTAISEVEVYGDQVA
jgi:serine/threonine-protein kinase